MKIPETHRLSDLEAKLLTTLQMMLRWERRDYWARKATPEELHNLYIFVRKLKRADV